MKEIRNDQAEPRDTKQPYAQPQLVKHGKVENLTQGGPPNGHTSHPPIVDP